MSEAITERSSTCDGLAGYFQKDTELKARTHKVALAAQPRMSFI